MSRGDDLDERILDILRQDARASNREIGRRLKIAEATVRARLKRMLNDKSITFGALVSPEAVGLLSLAFVRLMVAPQHIREVAAHIAKLAEAQYVGLTVGHYDVVAVLATTDRDTLRSLVEKEITPRAGVTEVDVRDHVSVIKHRYDEVRIKDFPGE